ncbi:MAG: Spy/CpxP family protein refolding chaperone [Longimicrobiales bacterium]
MRRASFILVGLALVSAPGISGQGVEAIMSARETLELSADQIQRLDAIRREIVAQRSAEMAEMAELRSQLAAGQVRRSEVIAAQEDRQAAAEGRAEERRTRIDAVLTEEQRTAVDQMRTRADRVRDRRQGFGPGRGGVGPGNGGVGRGGVGPGGFAPGDAGRGPRGGRGGFGPR